MLGRFFSLEMIENQLWSLALRLGEFFRALLPLHVLILLDIFRDSSKMRRFILVNQWYATLSFSLSLSRLSPGRINCISLPRKVAAKSEVTVKILISPALFRGAAVYLGYSPLSGFMVLYTLCFIFYSVHTLSLARSSPPRRDCMRNAPLVSPRERRYYAVGVLAPVLRTRTTLVPRFFSISLSLSLSL